MRPLPALQILRSVAALLVVVAHAAGEATARGFAKTEIDLPFGNFGVDIFFVISGFIIVYSSVPHFGRPGASLPFILRRFARIVPLYWIVSSLYLALIWFTGEAPGLSLRYIASSYLFIPYPEPQDGADFPFYFPGWTLEFELFFYLCFSTVLGRRRTVAVLALSGILAGVLIAGSVWDLGRPWSFWASSQSLEFVAGGWLADAYLRGWRLPGRACLALAGAAAAAVLVTSYTLGGWPAARGLVWGLPAAALVAAATLRGPAGVAEIPAPWRALSAPLVRLGDASYSLYVVHLLLFVAVGDAVQAGFRHWSLVPPGAYVALLTALAILGAFASFHLVERPLTRWLQRRIPNP